MTSRPEPLASPGMSVPAADQRVVLYGKTWAEFEVQIALRGEDDRRPKLAFLDGAIELRSPSFGHEQMSRTIMVILGFYCAEVGISGYATGAWLLKHAPEAGVEPDESFVFGDGRDRPSLVVEVVWTHGTVDKLEIYRRLGIPEVWWWEDGAITVFVLDDSRYRRAPASTFLPDLDLVKLCELAREPMPFAELQARVRSELVRAQPTA